MTKRVSEHADEIDKKEWDNLSDFLRFVYKGGKINESIVIITFFVVIERQITTEYCSGDDDSISSSC